MNTKNKFHKLFIALLMVSTLTQCKKEGKIPEDSPEIESPAVTPEENMTDTTTPSAEGNTSSVDAMDPNNSTAQKDRIRDNFNSKQFSQDNNSAAEKKSAKLNAKLAAKKAQIERLNALKAEEDQKLIAKAEEERLATIKAEQDLAAKIEEEKQAAIRAEQELQAKAEEEKQAAIRAEQEMLTKAEAEKALAMKNDSIRKQDSIIVANKKSKHYLSASFDAGFIMNSKADDQLGLGGTLAYLTSDKIFGSKKNFLTFSLKGFNNPYNGGNFISSIANGKNDALSYITILAGYRFVFKEFENGMYFEPRFGFVQAAKYSGAMVSPKLGYTRRKWDIGVFCDYGFGGDKKYNNIGEESIVNLGISLGYNFKLSK